MEDFQQRVVDEHAALAEKIGKLNKFMEGEVFRALPSDEQIRLRQQSLHMDGYELTLRKRIAAFQGAQDAKSGV